MSNRVQDVNRIAGWLARRDLPELSASGIEAACGRPKVDLLILLGGSIPYGCERALEAWRAGLADRFMIVGGIGHTTPCLQRLLHERIPEMQTKGRAEADILAEYFQRAHGADPSEWILETQSFNCGENASFALRTLDQAGIHPETVLLMQDSSMQRRSHGNFEKEWEGRSTRFFSYAAYLPTVREAGGELVFEETLWGSWKMERFLTLILGEIPRLHDTPEGYGPLGKGYLPHIDVPEDVLAAFERLREEYGELVRKPWSPEQSEE